MGSNLRGRNRQIYQDKSGSTTLLATDDLSSTPRTLASGKAKYTLFIQTISIDVTTDNAATLTFRDTASTPIKAAATKVSPGIGPIFFDLGEEGFALTEGKDFVLANSAAGLAAAISFTCFLKPTNTRTPADI